MLDHRFASLVEYRRSRTSHPFTMSAYFADLLPQDDSPQRFIIVMGTCKNVHARLSSSAEASDADRSTCVSYHQSGNNGFVTSGFGILHEGRTTSPRPQSSTFGDCNGEFGRLSNDLMFSRRLRSLRLQQNLSLFDLAQRTEVPVQFLADCEQGRREPTGTILQRLALALGMQSSKLSCPSAQ